MLDARPRPGVPWALPRPVARPLRPVGRRRAVARFFFVLAAVILPPTVLAAHASASGLAPIIEAVVADASGVVEAAGPEIIAGAAAGEGAATGAAAGAVCATGIGCVVLGALAIAGVAYATRDTWMPYLTSSSGSTGAPQQFSPDAGYLSSTVLGWPSQADSYVPKVSDPGYICQTLASYHDETPDTNPPPAIGACGSIAIQTQWLGPGCNSSGCAGVWQAHKDQYGIPMTIRATCRLVGGGAPDVTVDAGVPWSMQWPHLTEVQNIEPCGSSNLGAVRLDTGTSWTPGCNTSTGNCPIWLPIRADVYGMDATDQHSPASSILHQQWVAPYANDPGLFGLEVVRATTHCTTSTGSTYDVVGLPTDSAHGAMVDVPACNAGDTASSVTFEISHDGGAHYQPAGSSADLAKVRSTPQTAYPQCSGQACAYQIFVDHAACTTTTPTSACANWTVVAKADATRVECHYGPYTIDVSNCYFMERAYDGSGAPATGPNTDGNPSTSTGPAPQPAPGGYPVPTPTPTPTSTSSSTPTPTSTATTGTGTGTGTSPGSAGSPDPSSDPSERECFPSGWAAFNPVQWVLHPLRCAFEPDPSKSAARQAEISSDLSTTGVAPLITAVSGVVGQVGGSAGGSGCDGPPVTFSAEGVSQTLHPFSACTAPMSTLAAASRAVISLVSVVGGGLGLVRAVGSGFGWSFGFGRGAGSGGDD